MERANPATGERLEPIPGDSEADVMDAIDRAARRFDSWSRRPITERQQFLADAADVLEERADEYARIMTLEMGKPIEQAKAEAEKCAWVCRYYAEHGHEHLQDEVLPGEPQAETKVVHQPLGPVLAVMPWNFPFWQVFRFAAPALVAGNVGLLKHASNVPECSMAIESVFSEAGLPEGTFTSLLIDSSMVDDVLADDRVRAATLTGSGPAGAAVASAAGAQIKKTVLELGGSDPFVVLDDADVGAAAETAAWARCQNGGQSCIAAKRFVVHEAVYDAFLDAFTREMESLTVGDPTDSETEVGPQAEESLMRELHEQTTASVDAGATCVTGGAPLERDGNFYPPTVLTEVPDGAPADTDELFGPVAAVYQVEDDAAAVEKANDTEFGLGASVWTTDRDRGAELARRIEAGCVFVNEFVKSDPRLPFGGVKKSGYGRELSRHGIREFVNSKTLWIE